jgi:hypothetical protein
LDTVEEGKMSCWDGEIFEELVKGKKVKAEITEQNGYKVLAGIRSVIGTVEINEPTKFKKFNSGVGNEAMREASKMKKEGMVLCACLNAAVSYGIANKDSWEKVVANAVLAYKQLAE